MPFEWYIQRAKFNHKVAEVVDESRAPDSDEEDL